jgi:hypothetical protein
MGSLLGANFGAKNISTENILVRNIWLDFLAGNFWQEFFGGKFLAGNFWWEIFSGKMSVRKSTLKS